MLKTIIRSLFRFLIAAAHAGYGIEGINALLLIMPAKLIIPTLRRYGASIGEDSILHSPLVIHNAGNSYHNELFKMRIGTGVHFISLPMFAKLTVEETGVVINAVRKIFEKHTR